MAAAQYRMPFSRVQLFPQRLGDPERWPQPELVFVDSMADLLHEAVPDEFLDRVFDVLEEVPRHIYQILTKRPERARAYFSRRYGSALAPEHIWIGTSVEDERVLGRIDQLRATPARVRFLSCEPLIGSLASLDLTGIHWVIAGGESGRRRRPVEANWVRELRDKCSAHDVAFFFKQWGGLTPKAGGRELDGQTWDEYPAVSLSPTPTERRAKAPRRPASFADARTSALTPGDRQRPNPVSRKAVAAGSRDRVPSPSSRSP